MAKVLEGPGMGLMKKWGIAVPHHVVVSSVEELTKLSDAQTWLRHSKLVAKAHEALGSRLKLGLVKVDLDLAGATAAIREMLGRQVGSITVSQVIISEMIPHKDEYYAAVKSSREGAEILVANCGGIEVEANWDRVKKLKAEVGHTPAPDALEQLAKEAGFSKTMAPKVAAFLGRLFACFDNEDAQYLEVNPVVAREGDGELVALDAVTLLDADARFRHPDWTFPFAAEFGRAYSKNELDVMAVDAKIKGSVKFIAMLPAGGGASVYYSDAVVARGGKLANYAEYSGDPPDWAVEVLTEKVCSLPGIKNIIVGGAIANFTDVKKTFGGIIAGFRKAKAEGKLTGVKIWVRRGGPREQEGLEAMRALQGEGFDIHVFDRHTPLTDIVDMALQKKS